MPTFRHFMAVGVGAAIALSLVEPSMSNELPSLAKSGRNLTGNENQDPSAVSTQEQLTASDQARKEEVQDASNAEGEEPHKPQESNLSSVAPASPGDSDKQDDNPIGNLATEKQEDVETQRLQESSVINSETNNDTPTEKPNLKIEVRSQESEVRSQESEVRSQESEVRSQESEVRSQESGVRSQESGVRSQESGVRSQESGEIYFHPFVVNSASWMPKLKIDAGTRGHGDAETERFSSFVVNASSWVSNQERRNPASDKADIEKLNDVGRLAGDCLILPCPPVSASSSLTSLPRPSVPVPSFSAPEHPLPLKPDEEKKKNSAPVPGETVLLAAALAPESKSGRVGEWGSGGNFAQPPISPTSNPSNPFFQLDGAKLVQSPSVKRDPPAPGYLNPSPNPLLFPTRSEEVQVRTTQPITLQQAIELARRNNRTLEVERITLERERLRLQEALAAEFPTIGLLLDFSRSDSASSELQLRRQPNNQFLDNPLQSTFNGSLQVNYDLFTAGRRPAQIRQAEQQIRFQGLEVERISEQLRLDVTTAYYSLQQADAQVEINRAAVAEAAQSLRDAQLQERAGLGTRFDVLQAEVRLAEANQDLTRSLSQQRISRRQLVQLLSLNQTVDVVAADPIEVAGEWTLSLEQTIVLALKNRAELEQFLVQRDIGEQQRRIALADIRPQVSLTASYNIFGILNDQEGLADGFSLGARLQWNLFEGGAARARAAQARRNIEIAESQFADQRNQVRFDVEQAFFNLNANAQNIQTATFALRQAEESLRLARLRFQAGVDTQTNVIIQQTALTRARVNQLTAILDYNRALAQLQRATSNLPDSNLQNLP